MTDPISNYGRINFNNLADRRDLDRPDASSSTVGGARPNASGSTSAPQPLADDELILSETARQVAERDSFDPAKVEAIKRAISDGNYPLDSRRIAESFLAIERLL